MASIRAFICVFRWDVTSFDLLRQSEILQSTQRFILFRPNIPFEVKKRWTRVIHASVEFGTNERFMMVTRNLFIFARNDQDKLYYHRCFLRNSMMKDTFSSASQFSYFHFKRPLLALVLLYILALFVFLVEKIRIKAREKKEYPCLIPHFVRKSSPKDWMPRCHPCRKGPISPKNYTYQPFLNVIFF